MNTQSAISVELDGRRVEYRLVRSKIARKLRVRVGLSGVEVVGPEDRPPEDFEAFLRDNGAWVLEQLAWVDRFRAVRRPQKAAAGEILYRGSPTPVRLEDIARLPGANQVNFEDGAIVIVRGRASRTPPVKTLENWLRKQARVEIEKHLAVLTRKLNREPRKVYVMGQRTKWGNCSALQNLSFNWRLILAPDFVVRYLVTHEAVHLAVPDHSRQFWLTVQSLCPEAEQARQWLCANSQKMMVDLTTLGLCSPAATSPANPERGP